MTGNVTYDTVRMCTVQEKECVQPEKTKWYAPSLPLQALRVFRKSVLRQEQSLRCLFASVSHPRVSPLSIGRWLPVRRVGDRVSTRRRWKRPFDFPILAIVSV